MQIFHLRSSDSNKGPAGRRELPDMPGKPALIAFRRSLACLFMVQILLGSCSFSAFKGYRRDTGGEIIKPIVSWFRVDSGYLMMNTKIDLMNRHLSGIMIVKPLPMMGYRTVLITELGLKLLDMEFYPDRPVKVHYLMESLNRGSIIKTLAQDLELMLMTGRPYENPEVFRDPSTGEKVLKFKDRGRRFYYGIAAGDGRASNGLLTSGIVKKARVDYFSDDGLKIDSVKISHFNINLQLQFLKIHEYSDNAVE